MEMKNNVAIVTGGSSGLGEAAAKHIVEKGGKVAVLDLNEEKGLALVKELGQENALFIKTDVSNESEVQTAINITVEKFGKITTAINCAGRGVGNHPKKVINRGNEPHGLDTFSKVIQVNLIGTFNVLRLAAQQMAENTPNENGERGVIINTSSIAAYEGQIGQVAYSASKGGIVGMTLPVARDLARYGIRCVTIAPGLMDTPAFGMVSDEIRTSLEKMVPFPSRLGYPNEYAMLVQSIIENPMLNGETIRLDGAIRMQPK
ncbi:3-hydroxyacyl-CoA dehydrogenase/3-hydroxy-2-methylbutyryl-CoA dehydrogenase [Neobacillus niacini]|uniref:3-hydroxyacyl-CoA dehydrogenase n=1 Tax=Neobacillus niacini TaxID=86668 RepID=UPI0027840D4D|nr:3-hydroxyacyl-CoA dehydrogenase [Neobacillus niacini]MDQ1002195.1 3-hydroxyacyl-CoA dehydrogenase/3-hydroxy-2-methylbutyryl-CoA dehydrogenase [Neobacillus niacini]